MGPKTTEGGGGIQFDILFFRTRACWRNLARVRVAIGMQPLQRVHGDFSTL